MDEAAAATHLELDGGKDSLTRDGAGLHHLRATPVRKARSTAPSPSPSRRLEAAQIRDFLVYALDDDDAADEAEVAAYLLDFSDDESDPEAPETPVKLQDSAQPRVHLVSTPDEVASNPPVSYADAPSPASSDTSNYSFDSLFSSPPRDENDDSFSSSLTVIDDDDESIAKPAVSSDVSNHEDSRVALSSPIPNTPAMTSYPPSAEKRSPRISYAMLKDVASFAASIVSEDDDPFCSHRVGDPRFSIPHSCPTPGKPSNASAEVQCPRPPISPIKFFVGSTSTCSSEDQPHASRCMSPSPSPKTQTKVNLKERLPSMGKRKRGENDDDLENGPSTIGSRRIKKTCPFLSHDQTTCTL